MRQERVSYEIEIPLGRMQLSALPEAIARIKKNAESAGAPPDAAILFKEPGYEIGRATIAETNVELMREYRAVVRWFGDTIAIVDGV